MSSTDQLLKLLQSTTDVAVFQPSNEQRRAKSNFWMHFGTEEASPLPPNPSLALALRFGADKRIPQWWELAGFQDWFLNRDEFRQRMEYLSNLALDQLEEIIGSRTSMNSDKLSAIKLIMQVAQKTPTKASEEDSGLDKLIAKMNRVQLEEFIRGNLKLLPAESPSSPDVGTTIDAEITE